MSESSTVSNVSRQSQRIRIGTIVTHSNPHGDELTGITLLMELASPFDVRNAKIVTVKSDSELSQYWHHEDTLFIGIGGRSSELASRCPDRVFDEHGGDDKDACSADLVSRVLSVDISPFRALLDEVRLNDLNRCSSPTTLSAVLKARYEEDDEGRVIEWGLCALRALCRHLLAPKAIEGDVDTFLSEASEAYVQVGEANQMKPVVFRGLLEHLEKSAVSNDLTNIGTLFYVLTVMEGSSRARSWLRAGVLDMARRQVRFVRGVKEFKLKAKTIRVQTASFVAKVAFMRSDSGIMQSVFRSKDAGYYDILVLRNSRKQVGIFTRDLVNAHQDHSFEFESLIRMIRWAEIMVSGRKPHGWWSLHSEEEPAGVEEWFYFAKGRMIMNGSKSKPDVKPTRLTDEDIAYILDHAFTEEGVRKFMKENGVLDSRIA
jgi:hypothetical protein